MNNSKECLELLLSNGADGNIKNNVSNDQKIIIKKNAFFEEWLI